MHAWFVLNGVCIYIYFVWRIYIYVYVCMYVYMYVYVVMYRFFIRDSRYGFCFVS